MKGGPGGNQGDAQTALKTLMIDGEPVNAKRTHMLPVATAAVLWGTQGLRLRGTRLTVMPLLTRGLP